MWLKELAGIEIFEELAKEGDHRIKHRQRLMEQMYDVARQEEEYLDGAIGVFECCDVRVQAQVLTFARRWQHQVPIRR